MLFVASIDVGTGRGIDQDRGVLLRVIPDFHHVLQNYAFEQFRT